MSFAVHVVSSQCHNPTHGVWKLCQKIMRYLHITSDENLVLTCDSAIIGKLKVNMYSDADWAGDKASRKSISGGAIELSGSLVKWICKKQTMVTTSTMESEYVSASQVVQNAKGLWMLLHELDVGLRKEMNVKVDNQAAIKQIDDEGTSARVKHIDIKIKHVWNLKQSGEIKVEYLESAKMKADLMTKLVPSMRLMELKKLVGLEVREESSLTEDETS